MSKRSDDYEVGYGKPPKNSRFQKGKSGNPRGRPRKCLNFDHQLIRESRIRVPITENGRRKSVPKHDLVVKQLVNQAIKGDPHAIRSYLTLRQQALDKLYLETARNVAERGEYDDLNTLTDAQLMAIASTALTGDLRPLIGEETPRIEGVSVGEKKRQDK